MALLEVPFDSLMRRRNLAMRSRDGCKRGLIGGAKMEIPGQMGHASCLAAFVQSGRQVCSLSRRGSLRLDGCCALRPGSRHVFALSAVGDCREGCPHDRGLSCALRFRNASSSLRSLPSCGPNSRRQRSRRTTKGSAPGTSRSCMDGPFSNLASQRTSPRTSLRSRTLLLAAGGAATCSWTFFDPGARPTRTQRRFMANGIHR
jgi:hypothetical protein